MFTGAGHQTVLERLMAALEGGTLVVGNGEREVAPEDTDLAGDRQAATDITGMDIEVVNDPDFSDMPPTYRLLLTGSFGPDEANFDWRERGIKLADGTLIDRSVEDQGRKAGGFTVTVEHAIELTA